MVKCPVAGAYKAGGQGLLDVAISAAMAKGLEAHLQQVDVNPEFGELTTDFVQTLRAQGFSAKVVPEPLDSLQEFVHTVSADSASAKYLKQDVRFLAPKEDIDLLILLSIEQYGTIRKYYGFIPLGAPKAICILKGQMIDLQTNELRWVSIVPTQQATMSVNGEWDLPPDYPTVTAAIKGVFQRSGKYIEDEFFKTSTANH